MLTEQVSDPTAPSAGFAALYVKSGIAYVRNSSGIWTPMANPMTTAADLIVGGTAGAPARLAKGSDGQVLTVDPSTHLLVWATPAAASVATDALWDTAGDLALGSGANTAVKLAKGNDSDVLTVDPADHAVKWLAPSAPSQALTRIAQHVTAPGGEASYTFSAIPGTYETLILDWIVRCDNAITYQALRAELNGDTANNYEQHLPIFQSGGGTGYTDYLTNPYHRIGLLAGANAPANKAAWGRATWQGYARTIFYKGFLADSHVDQGTSTSGPLHGVGGGSWHNTAAITAIKLTPNAGNFIEGCVFTLYGLT
jgi:hypothetical protein